MNGLRKRLFALKGKVRRAEENFQGSLKDPLFLLGMVSVLLLASVSLGAAPCSESFSKGDISLANISDLFVEGEKQDSFSSLMNKFGPESPEFLLVGRNSLQAATPPTEFSPQVFGALVGGTEFESEERAVVEYIIEPADSLWSIAAKFNISLETVLWANDLNKYAYIQPGQKLIILPVSGVIHHVKPGDTISAVAQEYKAEAGEILSFNSLSSEADIFVGDIIVVPGGEIQVSTAQYAPALVPLANSYFICPISSPCRITQGLHWYNAIDFSHGKCGDPIYAAAAGQVLKVKLTNSTSKWAFGGAGNHITILHPNGVVTMYGHVSTALVSPGQQVSQGQAIALMGGQPGTAGAGFSTGCHLHFGVSGARNPFAY